MHQLKIPVTYSRYKKTLKFSRFSCCCCICYLNIMWWWWWCYTRTQTFLYLPKVNLTLLRSEGNNSTDSTLKPFSSKVREIKSIRFVEVRFLCNTISSGSLKMSVPFQGIDSYFSHQYNRVDKSQIKLVQPFEFKCILFS